MAQLANNKPQSNSYKKTFSVQRPPSRPSTGTSGFQSRGNSRPSFGGRPRFNRRRTSKPKQLGIDRRLYTNNRQNEVVAEKLAYIGKNYSDFHFDLRLERNILKKGFATTTEIQEKTIPIILEGKDLVGISATGSGKTGAFLIPMVQKLLTDPTQKLLIIAPTRELALQIAKEGVSFILGTHLHIAAIIGGQSMRDQIYELNRGAQIIVGTPGRINDLIKRGNIKVGQLNNIIVDEVDRLLDMGFIDDIRFIFSKVNPERQTLFFSATLNSKVERIVDSLSPAYDVVKLANNTPIKSVVQSIIDYTHSDEKMELLQELLRKKEVEKAIIFVDTKRFADYVDSYLYKSNFKVGVIHGDKRQNVRKRIIDLFKQSKISYLVATNVAARGLDIDDVTHVINLDEPQTYDEYIHRIGRTGRNGSFGTAYTFVKRIR